LVFAGISRSLLDHPKVFIESRKEAEAILTSSRLPADLSLRSFDVERDYLKPPRNQQPPLAVAKSGRQCTVVEMHETEAIAWS
jgi:hypothetical protein